MHSRTCFPAWLMIFVLCAGLFLSACSGNGDSRFRDGTYTGSAMGYVDSLTVSVTLTQDRITDIQLLSHSEYEHNEAVARVPQTILTRNTVNVESVSGATRTSEAIKRAVARAMNKALRDPADSLEIRIQEPAMQPAMNSKTTESSDSKVSLGTRMAFPVPVWVIGSYDQAGKPNMMTAGWVGIACSDPPSLTISLRKATYTYGNIMDRKAFTVNIPSRALAPQTAWFGSVSGRDIDKLAATGFTAVQSTLVDAPYLAEFPIVVECKLTQTTELGLHTQFIGEIMDVKADAALLDDRGRVDVARLHALIFAPGQGFFELGDFAGRTDSLRSHAVQ